MHNHDPKNDHPAVSFLKELFSNCEQGTINLRILPLGKNLFIPLSQITTLPAVLKEYQQQHTYFGVATRTNRDGTKRGVNEIPAVWIDCDFKDISLQALKTKLDQFPLKPSALINSGGGLHVYWFLKEPAKREDITMVEAINRRLASYFEGDIAAIDASRILRIPGTLNLKYTPSRPAKLIELKAHHQYELSDFEEILPGIPREERGNAPAWQEELLRGVKEGERNNATAKLAGRYLAKGLKPQECFDLLATWNKRNTPPLPDDELRAVIESVAKTDARNHQGVGENDPLQFPDHLMSGVAKDFADLYSSYIESPAVFLYFGFLTCLGSLIAEKLTLDSEIYYPPRLYLVCLGESADTRKSTAIHTPINFFNEFFQEALQVCYGIGSAEGLQAKIKESPGGRLLLLFDEFRSFVSKCRIEASVLLPSVNTLFDKTMCEVRTKTTSIKINNAHLSILAASTIQTYENTWTPQFLDIGFTNRLFLVPGMGKRRFPVPQKVPLSEKRVLAERVTGVIAAVGGGLKITLTPEARKVYDPWYHALGDSPSVHSKRIETYAERLMPLIAVNEGKTEVDAEVAHRVIEIMNWQLQVREQCDPIDAVNEVAKMEERVRRVLQSRGPLSERDLLRFTNANRNGLWVFNLAKKNLVEGFAPQIRYNRKSEKWELVVKNVVR